MCTGPSQSPDRVISSACRAALMKLRSIMSKPGGGLISCSLTSEPTPSVEIVKRAFAVDFILFAEGEIACPDSARYREELQCRKPAAEFVAKQIRMAIAEGRDVRPVLLALAEVPCLGRLGQAEGDPLTHWTRHYARDYLRAMQCAGSDRRLICVMRGCDTLRIDPCFRSFI